MSNVTIRQLEEQDWADYRSIRLRALQQHPDLYFGKHDEEAAFEESHWKGELRDHSKAVFGLYDDVQIVGLTGVFTWNGDASGQTAIMAMSFIEENYRGQGYSRLLYESRIAWAKAQPQFKKIRISHREGNEPSRRANQAFGFHSIGKEWADWPDGQKDWEHLYELEV